MQIVQSPMVIRFRKLEIGLLGVALAFALLMSVGAIAQTQNTDREARETWRLERQIDDLKQSHNDLKLNIEVRLAKIESYVETGAWLLGATVLLVVTQLGTRLLNLVMTKRAANGKE